MLRIFSIHNSAKQPLFCLVAVMAFLTACGSDSGSVSDVGENPDVQADLSAATFDKLPNCSVNREGNVAFVKDENALYSCRGGRWIFQEPLNPVESDTYVHPAGYYKTNCPAGHTCKDAAPSTYLNSGITYGEILDTRDDQVYKVVTIGDQVWMAQNLNYAYDVPTASEDSSSFCYGDDPDNCARYGRLYLWSAAMDSAAVFSTDGKGCGYYISGGCSASGNVRGVCPAGWHLPSIDELKKLAIPPETAILKSSSGWPSGSNGIDTYGFSAISPLGFRCNTVIPGVGCDTGFMDNDGSEGFGATFWSFSEWYDGQDAYIMHLDNIRELVDIVPFRKFQAFSVRCVQNSAGEAEETSSSSSSFRCHSESSTECGDEEPSSSSSSVIASSSSNVIASSSSAMESSSSRANISYGSLTDSRDGQTYKTVTIGAQTWMAQNLNYESAKSYCFNCGTYGRLYEWKAAMSACPTGWHLPSSKEWWILFTNVGGTSIAGRMLKSEDGWLYDLESGGVNYYGFTVLPAGGMYADGSSHHIGYLATFWSSTMSQYSYDYNEYTCYEFTSDAYINECGMGEYNPFSVRCLKDRNVEFEFGTLVDARDGQTYKTIAIGSQTWMAENLNYAYRKPTSSLDSSSFCYNGKADSCSKYGRLYLWSAAMDSAAVFSAGGKGCGYGSTCGTGVTVRGVCPAGWHLPSIEEWRTLFATVGGISTAGRMLKSEDGWIWAHDLESEGINYYGFSVLPAGFCWFTPFDNSFRFTDVGYSATFWSSSEADNYDALYVHFWFESLEVFEYEYEDGLNKDSFTSVRCIQNN